jgi:hypothetical protein
LIPIVVGIIHDKKDINDLKRLWKPDPQNFGLSIDNSVGHATCNGNIKDDFNEE